jgi:hypothetical protein
MADEEEKPYPIRFKDKSDQLFYMELLWSNRAAAFFNICELNGILFGIQMEHIHK